MLVAPTSVGAELVPTDRGGDVTYHGPGQLVGYPILSLPEWRAGQRDVVAYIRRLEGTLIDALADLGVDAGRVDGYTGVWVGDEKIAAIGVRVARGRTRHGFALNVAPDLSMFGHIVPCGISDRGVTSLAALLGDGAPSMQRSSTGWPDASRPRSASRRSIGRTSPAGPPVRPSPRSHGPPTPAAGGTAAVEAPVPAVLPAAGAGA